jgi:hypothetical protein
MEKVMKLTRFWICPRKGRWIASASITTPPDIQHLSLRITSAIHKHLSTTQLIVNLIDNTIKMGGGGEKLPGQYVDLPRAPKRTSSKLASFT